jgi:hypothetical protein
MQLPFRCVHGEEEMVDVDKLEVRTVSKLLKVEGWTCKHGSFNVLFRRTPSLDAAMQRLDNLPVTHRNFRYYFAKTLHKAEGVQKRSNHGAF